MARSRNIKPGTYKNEDLAECSIWARYIWPGLWMMADREGRLEDRPKRIKAELLPFDTQDVEPLLRELAAKKDSAGVPFIVRYQIDGVPYIQISKFLDHQTPHYSEKKSVIPGPKLQENSGNPQPIKPVDNPPDSLIPDSLNHESRFSDSPIPDSPPPPKDQRGEARASRLPPTWELTTMQIEWAITERPDWTPEQVIKVGQRFRDHWIAKPGKEGRKLDWDATWRNWVRGEDKHRPTRRSLEDRNTAAVSAWEPSP